MTVEAHVTGCEIVTLPPDYQDSPEPTQATALQRALSRRLSQQTPGFESTPIRTPLRGGNPLSVRSSVQKHLNDSTSSMNSRLFSDKKADRKTSAPSVVAHADSDLVAEFVVRSPVGETVLRDFTQEGMETALHQSVQPSTAVLNLYSGQSLAMKEEYEEEKRRLEQQQLIRMEDAERREEQEEMKRLLEQMQMQQAMSSEQSRLSDRRMSHDSPSKHQHQDSADAGIRPQALLFSDAQRTPNNKERAASAGQDEASQRAAAGAEPADAAALSRSGTQERRKSPKGAVDKVQQQKNSAANASPMPWPAPPVVSPVMEEGSAAGEEDRTSPGTAAREGERGRRLSGESKGGYRLPKPHSKPAPEHKKVEAQGEEGGGLAEEQPLLLQA